MTTGSRELGFMSATSLAAAIRGKELSPEELVQAVYERIHEINACERAGLPSISWHSFRHTHATLLSDLGESLKTAQAQLGHARLSTTAEIYTHVVPTSQRAAVEKLERAIWPQLDPNGPESVGERRLASSLIQ